MTLTDFDHQMIHHAKARGQVIVDCDGRKRLAMLWSWRPHRNGKRTKVARVQFPNGSRASVKIEKVSVL